MAKVCEVCGKGPTMKTKRQKLRGHKNPTSKKKAYPNLQWVRLPDSGERVKACTSCLKSLYRTD